MTCQGKNNNIINTRGVVHSTPRVSLLINVRSLSYNFLIFKKPFSKAIYSPLVRHCGLSGIFPVAFWKNFHAASLA
jgi:hypothetical protein